MRRIVLSLSVFTVLLAGCAIPPRPQAPQLTRIAPLDGVPSEAMATWPDNTWWTRYHNAQLDALESRALADAPTLAVARARFDQASRNVAVANAAGGLSIDGSAQLQRERLSDNGLIPPAFLGFDWYGQGDLGLQFNYDFDFWGSHGAEIAAAVDRTHAAAAERDSAAAMLTAAVADTYFGWLADQARLAIARDLVAGQIQAHRIADARVQRGVDSPDLLLQADAELADAREQVANLLGTAEIQRASLAALLGIAPANLPELKPLPLPQTEAALPLDAGLDLIARRADVAASRWRVEAALRDVDVARDAFYPNVSLSALAGLSSIDLSKLLDPGSTVVAIGPALHLPIFENGRLHARFGVSQAALAAAVADYNAAVVDAAHDAATQSLILQQARARLHEHAAQISAAEHLQKTAQARMDRGLVDARPVLAAAFEVDHQRDAAIQLSATALSADVGLIRALGGGYRVNASDSNIPNDSNANSAGATSR